MRNIGECTCLTATKYAYEYINSTNKTETSAIPLFKSKEQFNKSELMAHDKMMKMLTFLYPLCFCPRCHPGLRLPYN